VRPKASAGAWGSSAAGPSGTRSGRNRHQPRGPKTRWRLWWFAAVALVAVGTAAVERCRIPDAVGRPTWTVRAVHDGDTVTCHDTAGQAHKIRLLGIDAPEVAQPWGRESSQALSRKVAGRRVAVVSRGYDQHGRLLGTLWIDDRDINREMVVEGHAWVSGRIAPDPDLVEAESLARRERRGLWADAAAVEPSQWRAAHPWQP